MLTFGLLYAQQHLPLNPDGKGSLGALGYKDTAGVDHPDADTGVVFNTVCSFVTNTNLQHYSGEQHLSYFSQLGGIVWLMFVTPAAGLAVMLATLRGLRGDKHLGDFYLDMMRGLRLRLHAGRAWSSRSCWSPTGVPMTFDGPRQAKTLDGAATKMETQTIAAGPVAALVAIKQAGTNGGGFFGPNSAHPFENPDPVEQPDLDRRRSSCLPMASIVMAGLMLKNKRHAAVIYGVMLALHGRPAPRWPSGPRPSPAAATERLARSCTGANMEGKEVRFGPVASATWAAMTTGDIERLGQQHARQPQPDRRAGPDVA